MNAGAALVLAIGIGVAGWFIGCGLELIANAIAKLK